MKTATDQDMASLALIVFGEILPVEHVAGGLFNRVSKIDAKEGIRYLKQFADEAVSGSFPPLPTTAAQRCTVAAVWHKLALEAASTTAGITVPTLLSVHDKLHLLVMDEVQGRPLYDQLVDSHIGPARIAPSIIRWMAALHNLDAQPRAELLAASTPFKAFKIDLQYSQLIQDMPEACHSSCNVFIDSYIVNNDEPVHGDLNSRNIIQDSESISIIDFEQGQFGDGVYDLAYLVSEYVIRCIRDDINPEPIIAGAWDVYASARSWNRQDSDQKSNFRKHLAFQTLYRLLGPSRQVWTGHLSEASRESVGQWSRKEASRWFS